MNCFLEKIKSTSLISLGLTGLLSIQLVACGGSSGGSTTASSGAAPTGNTSSQTSVSAASTVAHAAVRGPSVAALPTGPYVTANVDVLRSTQGETISPNFLGLSFDKSEMTDTVLSNTDTALVNMMIKLGHGVLRIGANSVNTTNWDVNGTASSTTIVPADVRRLASLLNATGWKVIYGLNHATNTTANIASEAKYASEQFGSALIGFEIGNEPDLYASNGLRPKTYTYADFTAEWQAYYNAIIAAVPNAKVTAIASSWNYNGFTIPFAKSKGSQINLLTQHYYVADGQSPTSTMSLLLAGDPKLPVELQKLNAAAKASAIPLGYRLDEANSLYNGGSSTVSDAYGTALWLLDFLFINAENGSSGVNLHGGWTVPYSPIYDNGKVATSARPLYYGMLMFSMAVNGTVLSTQTTTAAAINFTSHAVAQKDGSTMVLLNNKDATKSTYVTVSLGKNAGTAELTTLSGTNLNSATGFTLNGTVIASSGLMSAASVTKSVAVGSSGTVTIAVPPMTAIMVHAS